MVSEVLSGGELLGPIKKSDLPHAKSKWRTRNGIPPIPVRRPGFRCEWRCELTKLNASKSQKLLSSITLKI